VTADGLTGPASPDPDVRRGIELHAAGRFHAAHGAFERAWVVRGRAAPGIQALVQIAAACLHLERGRRRPAERLLRRARDKLRRDPTVADHVRLDELLAGIDRCLEDVDGSGHQDGKANLGRDRWPTMRAP
jgi:predicted metal-dependent hydrolase